MAVAAHIQYSERGLPWSPGSLQVSTPSPDLRHLRRFGDGEEGVVGPHFAPLDARVDSLSVGSWITEISGNRMLAL